MLHDPASRPKPLDPDAHRSLERLLGELDGGNAVPWNGFSCWMWNGPPNFGGALFSHKTMVGIKRTAESLAH